jgi:polysaccharide biosynthesis protein PslH
VKVLFVSSRFPLPADTGGKVRILNLVRHLSVLHDVTFLSFARSGPVSADHVRELAAICEVREPVAIAPSNLIGHLRDPRWNSAAMRRQVSDEMRQGGQQFVIAAEVLAGYYAAQSNGAPRLLDNCELTVLYEAWAGRVASLPLRAWWTWQRKARFTAALANRFDACTVTSTIERNLLLRLGISPTKILVAANGVDLRTHRPEWGRPDRSALVYPGSIDFHANRDAMGFFVGEVLPRIRARHPEAHLLITGQCDDSQRRHVNSAAKSEVEFTGVLPDVRPVVARSGTCVVPLRIGGGTRVKILEAMALGTPVVSTSKGAEGLPLIARRHLLIADTPSAFADAVCSLMEDDALRATISTNALRFVNEQCDWSLAFLPIFACMEQSQKTAAGEFCR